MAFVLKWFAAKPSVLGVTVVLCAFATVAVAARSEFTGTLELELRTFAQPSLFAGVRQHSLSLAAQPQWYWASDDARHTFTVSPFLRFDSADGRRSHFDLRQFIYHFSAPVFELRAGVGKVFWGVTESRHLVDVINQTDAVENVDGEDKLGQPMLQLIAKPKWGDVELFMLPGFRERTFAGPRGRLRLNAYVDADAAIYESGARRRRIDWAVRYSNSIGVWDVGLAHFYGTSRTPTLFADMNALGEPRMRPRYDVVHRSSLDLQATIGSMLWKLETVLESGQGPHHLDWVAGGEYTVFGVADTRSDLGLLAEHLMDSRGRGAPQPFANDLFLGARVAFNDMASTQLLAGVIVDLAGNGKVLSLEASRRLVDGWTLDLEARLWSGIPSSDRMAPFARDDFLQFTLRHHF